MKKAILYIHGKGGSAQEADHYKAICREHDVIGLDYKAFTPWETRTEILDEYRTLRERYDSVWVIANSIGAYFAMNALSGEKLERAFFISPVVSMERLISDMMRWANVTEQELQDKQEIETAFGETLSWRYLCYVREHPVVWNKATEILYAENDDLIAYETVSEFAKKTGASLTVMAGGEHWFHTEEQMEFLDNWLRRMIWREDIWRSKKLTVTFRYARLRIIHR